MVTRVTFVGIHYKPGKEALDSSTPSGRKVDKVISQLGCNWSKINLFPGEGIPLTEQGRRQKMEFFKKAVPDKGVIILLGKDVQQYFPYADYKRAEIIKFRHPSFSSPTWSRELLEAIRSKENADHDLI